MTSHTCLDRAHKPVQISKQMASTSGHCLPGGNISSLPSSSWETEVQRDERLSPVRRSPCFRGDHSDIIQATIYSWFVRSAQYLKGISLLPRQTASSPGGTHKSWAVNFHLILRDVCDMSPALPPAPWIPRTPESSIKGHNLLRDFGLCLRLNKVRNRGQRDQNNIFK